MEAAHSGIFYNVGQQTCFHLHLPFHFLGFSWSSVSLGACSLEPTSVFPGDKNKRRAMAIFVTLHPRWNFMGQRGARGDFLC